MKKFLFMSLLTLILFSCNDESTAIMESSSNKNEEILQGKYLDPTQIWDYDGSGGSGSTNQNSISGDCNNGHFTYHIEEDGIVIKVSGTYYLDGSTHKIKDFKTEVISGAYTIGGNSYTGTVLVTAKGYTYDSTHNRFNISVNYQVTYQVYDYVENKYVSNTDFNFENSFVFTCTQTIQV